MIRDFEDGTLTIETSDSINHTIIFSSNKSPSIYEVMLDVNGIEALDQIFECDFNLFNDMMTDEPILTIETDCCILTYEISIGKRRREISIVLNKKEYEGENSIEKSLRDELTFHRNKTKSLEIKVNDLTKRLKILENHVGQITFQSENCKASILIKHDTHSIRPDHLPHQYLMKIIHIFNFADTPTIEYFGCISRLISNYITKKENEYIFKLINAIGADMNIVHVCRGDASKCLLVEIISTLTSMDVELWKLVVQCLKDNGADIHVKDPKGEKIVIKALNSMASRNPLISTYVLEQLS